jgi:hypothetical protein
MPGIFVLGLVPDDVCSGFGRYLANRLDQRCTVFADDGIPHICHSLLVFGVLRGHAFHRMPSTGFPPGRKLRIGDVGYKHASSRK